MTQRRPMQRRFKRTTRREVQLLQERPLAQIAIYPQDIVLTTWQAGRWQSYAITPESLITALAGLPVTPGLLPEGTISAGVLEGASFYVQAIPPRTWKLLIDVAGSLETLTVALPPLIWAGWKQQYRIFALASASGLTPETQLAHAPLPNVYSVGSICWGNVRVACADPNGMQTMLKTLLEESLFNTHLDSNKSKQYPQGVLTKLRRVAKSAKPYPLDDLVHAGVQAGELLSGRIWRRP